MSSSWSEPGRFDPPWSEVAPGPSDVPTEDEDDQGMSQRALLILRRLATRPSRVLTSFDQTIPTEL